MTKYYKFTDDFPSINEIQRLVAGYPDEEKLIEIIARSYDYIQKLPLKGITEDYDEITTPQSAMNGYIPASFYPTRM